MYASIELKDLLSPAVTLVSVLGAGIGVHFSLRANRRNQKRRQAFEAYNSYLTDCLAEPELGSGDVVLPKNDEVGWTHKFYKYQWLVGRFLGAAEEILEASYNEDWKRRGVEPGWRDAILGDARFHAKYFASDFFDKKELEMCSPEIQEIIEEVKKDEVRKRSRPKPFDAEAAE